MTVCASPATVDMRRLAPHDRYPVASAALGLLGAGDCMELVLDQDFQRVKTRFDANLLGKFSWAWLEQGPAVWRASLARVNPGHGNGGGCCGGCGGA